MKTSFQNIISKEQALKVLANHGLDFNTPTEASGNGGSFVSDFGDFPAYDREAIYSWLGY